MSVFSRIKEQISAFAHDSFPQRLTRESEETVNAEGLRAEMIELLEGATSNTASILLVRIRCATSLQSLWFMRGDLMAVLSSLYGEAEALHKVELACAAFREALPASLRSRPSPLQRTASPYDAVTRSRR